MVTFKDEGLMIEGDLFLHREKRVNMALYHIFFNTVILKRNLTSTQLTVSYSYCLILSL